MLLLLDRSERHHIDAASDKDPQSGYCSDILVFWIKEHLRVGRVAGNVVYREDTLRSGQLEMLKN
jgi:hypothetical protein